MKQKQKIVIVGGGITGLTATYYLQKALKNNPDYDVKLIEASNRLGGKIKTLKKDGYIIERGPDSFLARKEAAAELACDLGLESQLIRNSTGQAYIHVNGALHKMPKGSYMGVPVQLKPFWNSSLVSYKGKLRALCDYVLLRQKMNGDQSLGKFLRYRLGNELVENTIEPLLSGIYAGDIDEMSLLATFPNFHKIEQEHRSLLKGLQKTHVPKQQTGSKSGQFYSFKDGLETLVDALEAAIPAEDILLNTHVKQVVSTGDAYQVSLDTGEELEADIVIMTTAHDVLPKIFADYTCFDVLESVPQNSVANVALAFDESAIEQKLDGTGFVVSRNSDFRITACTWTYRKWENTTPNGKVLLRAYVGKPTDKKIISLSDEEIVNIVLEDLRKTMKIKAEPEFSIVSRWKNKMPQYTIGHQARVANLRETIAVELPEVYLVGSSYDGVGIPDCIGQAKKLVDRILTHQ